MSAYDDYAAKIKEQLDSLEIPPGSPLEKLEPQRLVPERGNGGIGGRDRSNSKVRGTGVKPATICTRGRNLCVS